MRTRGAALSLKHVGIQGCGKGILCLLTLPRRVPERGKTYPAFLRCERRRRHSGLYPMYNQDSAHFRQSYPCPETLGIHREPSRTGRPSYIEQESFCNRETAASHLLSRPVRRAIIEKKMQVTRMSLALATTGLGFGCTVVGHAYHQGKYSRPDSQTEPRPW